MSKKVIEVKDISKMYDLGLVGTGTLSKDLNRMWAKMLGKPDPYATLAEINDRTQGTKTGSVWALKNISFDVQQGEVLGIIGKNGAGKSTLLKILSKITAPTEGSIKMVGRVASLLEVGTGMHPEMTARENVYLNGSIMGMSRAEITSKLEEIVEFAGVGKYIDTPIKRFSSGMKVRLGFAVAAFLEPEILIIDEVLAVGDAEFQKKAVGKMQEVTKSGKRTVLFVSHNMAAVKSLCSRAILLENGQLTQSGNVDDIVNYYLTGGTSNIYNYREFKEDELIIDDDIYLESIGIKAENKDYYSPMARDENLEIIVVFNCKSEPTKQIDFNLKFKIDEGLQIFNCSTVKTEGLIYHKGKNELRLKIPSFYLRERTFYVDLAVLADKKVSIFKAEDIFTFNIIPPQKALGSSMGVGQSYLTPNFEWEVSK